MRNGTSVGTAGSSRGSPSGSVVSGSNIHLRLFAHAICADLLDSETRFETELDLLAVRYAKSTYAGALVYLEFFHLRIVDNE